MTDEAEAQWRTEVSGQLAALQARMVGLAAVLTENRQEPRGSWRAWLLAILVLFCSGWLVIIGIRVGLAASADAASAISLQTQAGRLTAEGYDAISRAADALQSGSLAQADKALAHVTARTFFTAITDIVKAQAAQRSADRFELEGPAVLAFGSSLAGAVLGWMLTQWFAPYARRSSRDTPPRPESPE